MIPALAVGVLVFWLGYDGGTYAVTSRSSLAIVAWWAIVLTIGLGLLPLARPTREALVTGSLLAAFAVLTAASMVWAASPEKAFAEFNRVALYLGVYLLAVTAATRGNVARWSDGIAIGVAGIALVALASRLFPGVFPAGELPRFLPAAQTRLSYPVNYWNGLAILLALGFPLLLRSALAAGKPLWRGLAVAPLPAFAAVIYLASSRGGFAALLIGIVTFVTLTARRWAAAGATAAALLGSAAAVAVLVPRFELVNGPLDSEAAAAQGRGAALLILLVCAATGLAYALASRYLPAAVRPGRMIGRVAAVSVAVAALAGIAAADPVGRFETFKEPPSALTGEPDFVKAHLLSGNGSGRWQFWAAAIDQFESRPALGNGSGSYEAWWAEHGTITMFVRDAHSLYLEVLGELGVVGFLVLVAAFASGIVAVARRIFRSRGEDRVLLAALAASFFAYALGVGIDWMWELTVVSVVGIALLGLVTGPATAIARRPRLVGPEARSPAVVKRSGRRLVAGISMLLASWLLICSEAIPLLTQFKIRDSQAAVERGDAGDALDDALAARNLQPWAASPYLQLALVQERAEDLEAARTSIREAIDRDSRDWRLWLVAARIETKAGEIAAARRSLAQAAALNPRSPLFADVGGGG